MAAEYFTPSGYAFFMDALADHLLGQPEKLASMRILLPNNRSIRMLKQVLLERSKHNALMMPEMMAFGALNLTDWISADHPAWQAPLPNVMTQEERLSYLCGQLRERNLTSNSLNAQMAYAESFLTIRDAFQRAHIPYARLEMMEAGEYAAHMERTIGSFQSLMQDMDATLHSDGWMEPVSFQEWLSAQIITEWERHPPIYPLIAAGTTGSQPSTAMLLNAMGSLPNAQIILPELDMRMAEAEWQRLPLTHPQEPLNHLLDVLNVSRETVQLIAQPDARITERQHAIADLMLPDHAYHHIYTRTPPSNMEHIILHHYADDGLEAMGVALHCLEALHQGKNQILVISEDSGLNTQLKSWLRHYDIAVNDSSGIMASEHEAFRLMMLVAELLFTPYRSATLLALMQHPLSFAQHQPEDKASLIRWLDAKLRGFHMMDSLASIAELLANYPSEQDETQALLEDVIHLCTYGQPFAKQPHRLDDYVAHHHHIVALLNRQALHQQDHALYHLSTKLDALRQAFTQNRFTISASDYVGIVHSYLAKIRLEAASEADAPVQILGMLEARLMKADRIIIPQCIEGVWPKRSSSDPWFNQLMRRQLGLDFDLRRIGLAAHDLSMCFTATDVVVTIAAKYRNQHAQPSRFYEKLALYLEHHDPLRIQAEQEQHQAHLTSFQHYITQPFTARPWSCPAPSPTPEIRMRQISATMVETLMHNPFELYVSHILKLREKDPLDMPMNGQIFGQIIHDILYRAARHYDQDLTEYAQALSTAMEEELEQCIPEGQRQFHQHRLKRIIYTLLELECERLGDIANLSAEQALHYDMHHSEASLRLYARIDRIERLQDDAIRIIDYKSGTAPTAAQVASGVRAQLLVAGWLYHQTYDTAPIHALEYWNISGKTDQIMQGIYPSKALPSIDWHHIGEHLQSLAAYYCLDDQALFLWNKDVPYWRNLASHLARIGEW